MPLVLKDSDHLLITAGPKLAMSAPNCCCNCTDGKVEKKICLKYVLEYEPLETTSPSEANALGRQQIASATFDPSGSTDTHGPVSPNGSLDWYGDPCSKYGNESTIKFSATNVGGNLEVPYGDSFPTYAPPVTISHTVTIEAYRKGSFDIEYLPTIYIWCWKDPSKTCEGDPNRRFYKWSADKIYYSVNCDGNYTEMEVTEQSHTIRIPIN